MTQDPVDLLLTAALLVILMPAIVGMALIAAVGIAVAFVLSLPVNIAWAWHRREALGFWAALRDHIL